MDKEIDSVLDLQIEVVQVSIYCEIIKDILLKHRSISAIKIACFSFVIKKRHHLCGSIYRGNNKVDLVLKFLSQVSGLFDDLCDQLLYIFQAIDLLVQDGFCEAHEGELICVVTNATKAMDYDAFIEAAIQESKLYSDRQFLREVISIV